MNRATRCTDEHADATNAPAQTGKKMTSSHAPIASTQAFPRLRAWRCVLAATAIAAVVAPGTADAAARRAGTYDGTWNVVFATTRGNCSSGYSVPFTVTGSRVSSAGGGKVSGAIGRGG